MNKDVFTLRLGAQTKLYAYEEADTPFVTVRVADFDVPTGTTMQELVLAATLANGARFGRLNAINAEAVNAYRLATEPRKQSVELVYPGSLMLFSTSTKDFLGDTIGRLEAGVDYETPVTAAVASHLCYIAEQLLDVALRIASNREESPPLITVGSDFDPLVLTGLCPTTLTAIKAASVAVALS